MPINCTIIVGVKHLSFFTLFYFRSRTRSQKNFVLMHTLYKTGGTLCVRLCPNRFTYLHTLGANQLYLSFWLWPHFRSKTRSQKLRFFCMLYLNHNDWQLCHFLHVNLHSHNYIPTILGGGGPRSFWSAWESFIDIINVHTIFRLIFLRISIFIRLQNELDCLIKWFSSLQETF